MYDNLLQSEYSYLRKTFDYSRSMHFALPTREWFSPLEERGGGRGLVAFVYDVTRKRMRECSSVPGWEGRGSGVVAYV